MTPVRHRHPVAISALFSVAALVVASCAGSSAGESSSTESGGDTSAPASTPTVTDVATATDMPTGTDDTAPGDVGPRDVIASQLALLPRGLVEAAENSVTVTIIDVAEAARQAEVTDPLELDDDLAIADAFVELAQPDSVANGGTGLGFATPVFFPADFGVREPVEFEAEFGFSPFDVRTVAELAAPPVLFSAVTGDLTISDDLVPAGDGVVTVGPGVDFEPDFDNRTDARPLGRPHHVAQRDESIAVTIDLPTAVDWAGGGDSLADDARWAAVADRLDASGVAGATLLAGTFSVSGALAIDDPARVAQVEDAVQISTPFDLVGVGSSRADGQTTLTVVYHFVDDAAAAGEVDNVAAAWAGDSLVGGDPLSTVVSNVRTEQVGGTVTMVADVDDTWSTRAAISLVFAGDLPFLHR